MPGPHSSTFVAPRDACILVLSNGFAVGCLVTIILHMLLPEEHDKEDPDDIVRDPMGEPDFTSHPKARDRSRTPAANDSSHGMGGDLYKQPDMAHMNRNDDTAHGKPPNV